MLSKKMAFSLMSLITLFALAFAVPSVMAADEITPKISAVGDAYGEDITVTLTFDKPVGLANLRAAMPTVMSIANDGTQSYSIVLHADADCYRRLKQRTRMLWHPGFKLMIKPLQSQFPLTGY